MMFRDICLLLFSSSLLAVHAAPDQYASLDRQFQTPATRPFDAEQAMAELNRRIEKQPTDYEASLIKGLLKFKAGDRQGALQTLDALIDAAPDFHLAYLLRADIRLSLVQPVTRLGDNSLLASLLKKNSTELQKLHDEARVRLQGMADQPWRNRMPRQILALGASVRNALLVDKTRHRLYVYSRGENGELKFVNDYYVSTGKLTGNKKIRGDLRTPEGVYFVTAWIPPSKLPDKYGIGAFPVNYPNELDRHQGKTGYGIWLHGTESDYYSRPPLDSEGCVVLTNMDLQAIKQEIKPGTTPVVITRQVSWLDREQWQKEKQQLQTVLERWRQDWQSLDVERYLTHYSDEFWSKGYDIKSWKQRKRTVARNKTYQQITLTDVSLLAYPESAGDIVVARFRQAYQSNNYQSDINKRLYLKHQDGEWKIVYEGP